MVPAILVVARSFRIDPTKRLRTDWLARSAMAVPASIIKRAARVFLTIEPL
jgi:hypothetical protein